MIQVTVQKPKVTVRHTGAELRGMTDERLSLGATEMWRQISQLPDDFEFTLEDLQRKYPVSSARKVAQCYRELIDCGYIQE